MYHAFDLVIENDRKFWICCNAISSHLYEKWLLLFSDQPHNYQKEMPRFDFQRKYKKLLMSYKRKEYFDASFAKMHFTKEKKRKLKLTLCVSMLSSFLWFLTSTVHLPMIAFIKKKKERKEIRFDIFFEISLSILTLTRSFTTVTRASLIQIIHHFVIHC